MRIAIVALLIAATNAEAALVYRDEHSTEFQALELLDSRCRNPKILVVYKRFGADEKFLRELKAAKLTWAGKTFQSCWFKLNKHVLSIDEDGAPLQPLPLRMFKDPVI